MSAWSASTATTEEQWSVVGGQWSVGECGHDVAGEPAALFRQRGVTDSAVPPRLTPFARSRTAGNLPARR